MNKTVAIVGGGAAGCAAAHKLSMRGVAVTIFERSDQLGGRMRCDKVGDREFEVGAGFLTSQHKATNRLVSELGLSDSLFSLASQTYLCREPNSLQKFDAKTITGRTGILSSGGRKAFYAEVGKALAIAPMVGFDSGNWLRFLDRRSVSDALTTPDRLEILDRVFAPLLAGLFYWSPKSTSELALRMTLKGILFGSDYRAMSGGLSQICSASAAGCEVVYGSRVRSLERLKDGGVMVALDPTAHNPRRFDAVICAVEGTGVRDIDLELRPAARVFLQNIKYSTSVLLVATEGVEWLSPASSVLFAPSASAGLSSVTRLQSVDPRDSPSAGIKIFASPSAARSLVLESDQDIADYLISAVSRVGAEFVDVHGGAPHRIYRWPSALPELPPGYISSVRDFVNETDHLGSIYFAGDYLAGPLVEGAVNSGHRAADAVLGAFGAR